MTESTEKIWRGLDGIVADETTISMVNEATNSLLYHGYPVQDLAASCSFEEVAYLIWYGDLPNANELAAFTTKERARRGVPEGILDTLAKLPTNCHPMDILRSAVSLAGAADPKEDDASPEANLDKSIAMVSWLPTVVAFEQRRRRGESVIAPTEDLSYCENFFQMCFGEVPEREVIRCFEVSMILYAEHSFNASTFTARVITSTLSDIYSSVTGAIGALKGPLHGGANEAVMDMFEEIEDPDKAVSWLAEALATQRKIMGFGHRVYKHGDSRVPTMRASLESLAKLRGADRMMAVYDNLEQAMIDAKGIHPNLDYVTGPAYHLMGFDTPMFTPLFVMSRITGWTAHVMEQLANNNLIRPLSAYIGEPERRLHSIRELNRW